MEKSVVATEFFYADVSALVSPNTAYTTETLVFSFAYLGPYDPTTEEPPVPNSDTVWYGGQWDGTDTGPYTAYGMTGPEANGTDFGNSGSPFIPAIGQYAVYVMIQATQGFTAYAIKPCGYLNVY